MLALNRVPLPDRERRGSQPPDPLRDCHALTPEFVELDQRSALEWLQSQRQSKTALDRFWSTIIVSALGEELSRVGLLAMAKVFQDGFLRDRDAFHLLIPRRPLDELFGWRFQAALVEAGVEVITGTSVVAVEWEGALCRSVKLADGRCLPADDAVVALPWHCVERLVGDCPDATVRAIGQQASALRPSPISGVHTWWDRAWLPTSHAVLVDRLCQWIFPRSPQGVASAGDAGIYYQIVISASRMLPGGSNEPVRKLIEADIQEVFPEARSARLLRLKVVTDPNSVFSVAPGTTQLRPPLGARTGNLVWAGDWVRTGWPATMEGAIRSGLAAAAALTHRRPVL
jgi:zeta-carotene desaturase